MTELKPGRKYRIRDGKVFIFLYVNHRGDAVMFDPETKGVSCHAFLGRLEDSLIEVPDPQDPPTVPDAPPTPFFLCAQGLLECDGRVIDLLSVIAVESHASWTAYNVYLSSGEHLLIGNKDIPPGDFIRYWKHARCQVSHP